MSQDIGCCFPQKYFYYLPLNSNWKRNGRQIFPAKKENIPDIYVSHSPPTSSTSLGGSRWPDPGVLIKYLRYHGNQISGQDICFSRKEGWKTGKTWHIIKRLADLFEPIGISLHLFPDIWYFYRHLLYIYIVFGLQILWSINYYNVGNCLIGIGGRCYLAAVSR